MVYVAFAQEWISVRSNLNLFLTLHTHHWRDQPDFGHFAHIISVTSLTFSNSKLTRCLHKSKRFVPLHSKELGTFHPYMSDFSLWTHELIRLNSAWAGTQAGRRIRKYSFVKYYGAIKTHFTSHQLWAEQLTQVIVNIFFILFFRLGSTLIFFSLLLTFCVNQKTLWEFWTH